MQFETTWNVLSFSQTEGNNRCIDHALLLFESAESPEECYLRLETAPLTDENGHLVIEDFYLHADTSKCPEWPLEPSVFTATRGDISIGSVEFPVAVTTFGSVHCYAGDIVVHFDEFTADSHGGTPDANVTAGTLIGSGVSEAYGYQADCPAPE